jgi:hypothetical protein
MSKHAARSGEREPHFRLAFWSPFPIRLRKYPYSVLQGLKPLKNTERFVVPKGTTHKPYEFFRSVQLPSSPD